MFWYMRTEERWVWEEVDMNKQGEWEGELEKKREK